MVKLVEVDLIGLPGSQISSPAIAAALFHELIGEADREHFAALYLDAQHHITHAHIISRGSVAAAPVHPREVFKAAILSNASALIVGHNHPSGVLEPSTDDHGVHHRLAEAGQILGVTLLDMLIVGPTDHFYASSIGGTRPLRNESRKSVWTPTPIRALAERSQALLEVLQAVGDRHGEGWWTREAPEVPEHLRALRNLLGLKPYLPPDVAIAGNSPMGCCSSTDEPGPVEP